MNKKRDPIVWVVQESWASNVDLSSAQQYGKIQHILNVTDRPGMMPESCLNKIRAALDEYQDGDYFATTLADPAGPLLLGLALADFGFDDIKWLRWERPPPGNDGFRPKGGFYVPGDIPCSGFADLLEPVG